GERRRVVRQPRRHRPFRGQLRTATPAGLPVAMSMDLSPLQRFLRGVAGEATLVDYATQGAAALFAVGLAWLLARLLCRRLAAGSRWQFGEGGFERVAFPLFAYLLLALAIAVLAPHQRVASLEIARSIVLAALAIRAA